MNGEVAFVSDVSNEDEEVPAGYPSEHEGEGDEPLGCENEGGRFLSRMLLQSTPTDGSILLEFKQAIVNDSRGILRGWNATANEDYCGWHGVTCNLETRRVIGLNLTGKKTEAPN